MSCALGHGELAKDVMILLSPVISAATGGETLAVGCFSNGVDGGTHLAKLMVTPLDAASFSLRMVDRIVSKCKILVHEFIDLIHFVLASGHDRDGRLCIVLYVLEFSQRVFCCRQRPLIVPPFRRFLLPFENHRQRRKQRLTYLTFGVAGNW